MKIKEFSEFVDDVTLFWFFGLELNDVSIIEWKNRLISCLDGWAQRKIMCNVCLSGVDSVPVEIILHQLTLFESDKDCAKTSQKGESRINLKIGETAAWTVDSLSNCDW